MKQKSFKIVLVIILTLLLTVTVSACNGFGYERVDAVTIHTEGLEMPSADGKYSAVCGREFTLTALITPEDYSGAVVYNWFRQVGSGKATQIIGEGGWSVDGVFKEKTDAVYTYYVTANGIKSANVSIRVLEYASLDDVYITSETNNIVQNTIQIESGNLSGVELSAAYGNEFFKPDYEAGFSYKWSEDDVEIPSADEKTYIYVSQNGDDKTKISVEISDGVGISKVASVYIVIVYDYEYVDEVNVEVGSAEKKAAGHYFTGCEVVGNGFNIKPITLSAAVTADDTNLYSPTVWTQRTESGTVTLNSTEREISVQPKYGKNVFTATIDNVASSEVTVYALPATEYRRRAAVINDTFNWYGNLYSFYIMDEVDLSAVINYLIAEKKIVSDVFDSANIFDMYLQPLAWRESSGGGLPTLRAEVGNALQRMDVSGYFSVNYTTSIIYLSSDTVLGKPEKVYEGVSRVEQNQPLTHFSVSTENRSRLAIDSASQTVSVNDSDALFRAVGSGIKPVFPKTADGKAVEDLYNNAREVLYGIIDDTMTEYEKVRAIYEWIVSSVKYDYDVVDASSKIEELLPYNAFYLEGVFNDKKAVCDGKSKAFTLMCGMEGIRSMRIIGRAGSEQANRTDEEIGKLQGHAWNKVLVDADANGVREWFVVDTTWGDVGTPVAGTSKYEEFLTMSYFLITDNAIKNTHYSNCPQPSATTEFDYYAAETFESGGKTYSFDITSSVELKAALKYSKENGGVLIDVKNNFDQYFSWYVSKFVGELGGKTYSTYFIGKNSEENNWLIALA